MTLSERVRALEVVVSQLDKMFLQNPGFAPAIPEVVQAEANLEEGLKQVEETV